MSRKGMFVLARAKKSVRKCLKKKVGLKMALK